MLLAEYPAQNDGARRKNRIPPQINAFSRVSSDSQPGAPFAVLNPPQINAFSRVSSPGEVVGRKGFLPPQINAFSRVSSETATAMPSEGRARLKSMLLAEYPAIVCHSFSFPPFPPQINAFSRVSSDGFEGDFEAVVGPPQINAFSRVSSAEKQNNRR